MNTEKPHEAMFASLEDNLKLLESMGGEFRDQAKNLFQAQLSKMDLVTREEFDATLRSLERATERIAELEKQIADLK